MRAIIPVAGIGTRLRPHTFTTPKVLLNVAGKPILAHILDSLVKIGVTKSTIITGYMGDSVIDFVTKKYPGMEVDFVHQEETLGLGHAIWTAKDTFNNDPLIIILGDTIFDVDLNSIFDENENSIGVKYVEDPRRFGVVLLNEHNKITKLIEKPQELVSNLAIVGIYYIKNSQLLEESLNDLIVKNIRTKNEYQLTDALQIMLNKGAKFKTFNVDGWYDCGKPETLLSTNQFLLNRLVEEVRVDGSVIIQPSFISNDAKIENSVIGPYASIADDAIVKDSIVKNSIISYGASVSNSLLDESIIGNDATVNGMFQKLNVGNSSSIDYSRETE
ncbi:MAG: nucleotidyl transferase [Ignavibacteria bacterium GWF2_33_9]|nr:MAG: nucleotidyl transferase [Ignavibacteria bacterium GWF2_33_9]